MTETKYYRISGWKKQVVDQFLAIISERDDALCARIEELEQLLAHSKVTLQGEDAEQVLLARVVELERVLRDARRAIASLDDDALGRDPIEYYPYKCELLENIDKVLGKEEP